MGKHLLLFVVGVTAGAVAVYVTLDAAAPRRDEGAAAPVRREAEAAPRTSFAVDRLVAIGGAGLGMSVRGLREAIAESAAEPSSPQRDAALEALVARLAGVDALAAVRSARELGLDERAAALALRALAYRDLDAALGEIAALQAPDEQHAAALAIFDAVALESGAVERVAAALPAAARFRFTADALEVLATRDTRAAVELAATLNTQQQATVLPRIAAAAGRTDPAGALAQGALLSEPSVRLAYTNAVFAAWAAVDSAAVFAHFEASDGADVPNDAALFAALAASDADRLLAAIERFPPDARLAAQRAAIGALAERDPASALARLESVPPGNDRERLMQTIGTAYARVNPDAAIRWAALLNPPSQTALNGIVGGIAAADAERAVDFVLREVASPTMPGLDAARALSMTDLYRHMNTGRADVAGIAERLLASGNATLRTRASAMVSRWISDDAPTAVEWIVAHADRFDSAAVTSMAGSAGISDAALAGRVADRLPAELRSVWIAGAANGIALQNPAAAEQFLEPYRGEPGYAQGVRAVAERMLEADPAAARAWLLALPAGTARDAAITGYLVGNAAAGSIDAQLVAAFSSDAERQRSLASAIQAAARANIDYARRLFDAHLTDPTLRGQVEPLLRGTAGAPGQSPVFPRIVMD